MTIAHMPYGFSYSYTLPHFWKRQGQSFTTGEKAPVQRRRLWWASSVFNTFNFPLFHLSKKSLYFILRFLAMA